MQAKSTEKLSSGYRVNRAADDAAGLAISEKMRTQIRGLGRASINIQDGVSLTQVADGALKNITDMVQRMRELAVQAANDTNSLLDRQMIQLEINQLTSELNYSLDQTDFNGRKLFDGSIVGTYMYNYGLKDAPMISPTDPAQILANAPFEQVRVPRGSQPSQNTLASSGSYDSPPNTTIGRSHLNILDGPPPIFPNEGEFIIRITDPDLAPGGINFILDFAVENMSGNFTSADFESYFQNAFNTAFGAPGSPPSQGATISVAGGEIRVETHGLGGSASNVLIGATNLNAGVGRPAGTVFANSAIFGASIGSGSQSHTFRVQSTAISPADLATINLNPSESTLLWNLVPDSTVFTWQAQEWRYRSGSVSLSSSYDFDRNLHTVTMTKGEIIAASGGASTFAEANDFLATQGDGTYFSRLTLGTPSVYVNRSGTTFINFGPTASAMLIPYDPALPQRYRLGFSPGSDSRTNTNVHATSMPTVTSSFPARIPEWGLLTINISNVPTSPTTTTTRTLNIDFTDSIWDSATPSDLVDYINAQLNDPSFWPEPLPEHTRSGYNPSQPVATASLVAGNLVITAAERSFTVSVQERMSEKPMYLEQRYATNGVNWTPSITIRDDFNIPIATIPIAANDYDTIDDFIAANRSAFNSNGFMLSNDAGKLVITSIAQGGHITVGNISISGSGSHDWGSVMAKFGLFNLPAENFINGISYPPEPVDDSSLWIQAGANKGDGILIGIPRLNAQDLGLMLTAQDMADPGSYNGISTTFGTLQYTSIPGVKIANSPAMGFALDVTSHEKAAGALDIFTNAINILSMERANIGAITNRLEFAKLNVDNSQENLAAAESQIRDTDMAKQMTLFTKEQILTQASTAMLAQANALPQNVLQLLG